jgi:hypothetical protein
MSHGFEHLLDGSDLTKLELGVETVAGDSAAASGSITATATDGENGINAATNAAMNAATNAAANATSETINAPTNAATDSNATQPVAAKANEKSKEQQEQAKLIKDIATAAKVNALYASLLSTGTLAPLSHVRQLTDYLAILLFETRTFPLHQLNAEAEVAHESYSRLFPAEKVPPIAVLVAAKKEMMEKGGVDVEATDVVNEWAGKHSVDFDEEGAKGLEKDVVRARLKGVLQECLEMLNAGDEKRKKREKSKRNRKNKKAAKQVEEAGVAGEDASEKAGVAEKEARQD